MSQKTTDQLFQQIYLDHAGYVRKTLFFLVPAEMVDDLVQETFVKIWKGLSRFDQRSHLKTWIYRIAVNVARDRFRRERWRFWASSDSSSESDGGVQEKNLEISRVIQKGIMKLDEKKRVVFTLFFQQELSQEEIAEILEIPVGTVKSRVYAARSEFIDFLKSQGVEYVS